jgi:Mg2+-importing ATPase
MRDSYPSTQEPNTPYWSREAAAARLRRVGANSVEDASHPSALGLLLRQYESPLVLILIVAAVISLTLQEWVDAAIILAIVLGSTLLGFVQEYRAPRGRSNVARSRAKAR